MSRRGVCLFATIIGLYGCASFLDYGNVSFSEMDGNESGNLRDASAVDVRSRADGPGTARDGSAENSPTDAGTESSFAGHGGTDGGDSSTGHAGAGGQAGGSGACTDGITRSVGSCSLCGGLIETCLEGAWGDAVCTGQGECASGEVGTDACDLGETRMRTCGNSCVWGDWSACPSCTDRMKNGLETDKDCGGVCPGKCNIGQGCSSAGDCVTSECSAAQVCSGQLTIRLVGTGAADSSSWMVHGRQLSSMLANDNLLVDLSCWTNNPAGNTGTCGVARLQQFGIDVNAITHILITHYHQDHLDPGQMVALAQARTSQTPLTLCGGVNAVNTMSAHLGSIGKPSLIQLVHLAPYTQTAVGPYMVTPLIASHDTPETEPYVYVIEYYGRRIFYGTDSDVLSGTSLTEAYATTLDLVIRERTFESGSAYGHMDRDKLAAERADFIAHGVVTAATPYLLTHIAYCSPGHCSIPAGTSDPGDGATMKLAVP